MLRDEARLLRGQRHAALGGVTESVEQPQIPGAVDRHLAARAVSLDAEAALLHAGGAREAIAAPRVHQQHVLLALAVAGGIAAVAQIPDVLAEGVRALRLALQCLAQ